ncbi:hypothetical protein ACVXG9_27490 [Escherichia coli]
MKRQSADLNLYADLEPPTTGDSGDKIGPAPGLQQLGDDRRG